MKVTMRKYISYAITAVLTTAAALSATKTSTAGAFPVDTVTAETVAQQDVIQAHWNGGGFFAGAVIGGLFGAALASPYYYPGYYGYAPYYGYGGYPYYGHYGYGGYPHYRYYGYAGYPRYRHYGYWGHRHWW